MRPLVLVAVGWCLAVVVVELLRSRRNERRLLQAGARFFPGDAPGDAPEDAPGDGPGDSTGDGLAGIAAVHTTWFLSLLVEERLLGPHPLPPAVRVAAALLYVAAEATRLASMASLGKRWSARVLTPLEPLVRRGPYRLLRHPAYVAVAVLLVNLPLALGLVWTAAWVGPAKLFVLRKRIRVEERALRETVEGLRPPAGER